MKRTPIIISGQVYLHTELNEYAVVTSSTRQMIRYAGVTDKGGVFSGVNDAYIFLDRFEPVNPADLDDNEAKALLNLLTSPMPLSIGWVSDEGEDDEEELE